MSTCMVQEVSSYSRPAYLMYPVIHAFACGLMSLIGIHRPGAAGFTVV